MFIITGASEGLGAAIAQVAQENDFPVANIARRANPDAERNIIADLSSLDGVSATVEAIKAIDRPTALVLNAGTLSLTSIATVDSAEYERVMNLNLRAPLLLLSGLYDWIRNHEIDIVIINSIASQRGNKGQVTYDISKWGLRGLTEDLRLELKDTACRVIGAYPGMLDTNMAGNIPENPLPKSKKPTISSDDLAKLIVRAVQTPKSMEVSDIIVERKTH